MAETVLLTGATGFLGAQTARRLLCKRDCHIIALVRASGTAIAQTRLSRAWWDWPELAQAIGAHVSIVCGDITAWNLGLEPPEHEKLIQTVTHIIHTAADVRLHAPIRELRRTNVDGTANVLRFARAVQADHGLARLSHVSTAYVAGGRQGIIYESELTDAFGFASPYERSKYEGEVLIRAAKQDLPICVFRPAMIVGDSQTGEIRTFNTLYYLLRLYLTGKVHTLPLPRHRRVNIVPVDYVADAIAYLTFDRLSEGLNFHLTAPYCMLPRADELAQFVRDFVRDKLDVRLPHARFLPLPGAISRRLYTAQSRIQPGQRRTFEQLLDLLPYFAEERVFSRNNLDLSWGPCRLEWRQFMTPILAFAIQHGFLHRSGRTIHEQILYRLKSHRRPVTFHDITAGQPETRSGDDVHREMLAAAAALKALDVRPGDRVAITGVNSSRYLTLDVAIGLLGAISVPLAPTSPPSEVTAIIRDSGAMLLLVGASSLLESLGRLDVRLPTVSFCIHEESSPLPSDVIGWPDFLARGAEQAVPDMAPVELGDLATVRYTSGTTGQPKGVAYRHDALRWMAQSLTPLFPWKARNRPASYLSFLPVNHVVEGILGIYAPYYVPAVMDIYFLDDFAFLRRALSLARPHIFFCVPRFFEKLYDAANDNPLVRRASQLPPGSLKRILQRLLGHGVLRKAGLDRCVQLIVGAATPVDTVLRFFQEMGIEIHNAYGLTEAPLVTLNRLGSNRIGTVGTPLPETEIRLASDGEIRVRGPQAAAGYFADGQLHPFEDGWVDTGDLGHIDSAGRLVLIGRKGETIITSYGKNVHPARIEAVLREIPHVSEAMLVGEGKPYCVALLWVDEDIPSNSVSVDHGIRAANEQLSRPEQVKRWAVLPYNLTIETGDLTPSLKMNRQVVAERHTEVIQALYAGGDIPEDVLHSAAAF